MNHFETSLLGHELQANDSTVGIAVMVYHSNGLWVMLMKPTGTFAHYKLESCKVLNPKNLSLDHQK